MAAWRVDAMNEIQFTSMNIEYINGMECYRFFFFNPFRELGWSLVCQMAGRTDVCQWIVRW